MFRRDMDGNPAAGHEITGDSLKDETLRCDTKANYMTVPAALRELDKIEMVKSLDGNYRIDHAITASQKAILNAFGIDVPYIKRKAALINSKLT